MAEENNIIVWVQLYIGEDKSCDVFKMRVGANHDIDDLKKAVHQARGKSLGHCDAADLVVYKAGTEFPTKEEDKLRPSLIVPTDTTDENPLRVLAPLSQEQRQQQQQPVIDNELLLGVKRALERNEDAIYTRPTPTMTPAFVGQAKINELTTAGLFKTMSGTIDQPPVLNTEQLAELSSLSTEHQVVAYLTPFFEKALADSDIQVINSEQNAWLVTTLASSRYNQRPDNIFCSRAIYSHRNAFDSVDEWLLQIRRNTDKFGVLSDWRLRDCIDAIGEAKLNIDHEGFGEVINYARHICYGGQGPIRTKLILYDKTKFWLVFAVKGEIALLQTCDWSVPGSRTILTDFFNHGRSPWIELLNAACTLWELTILHDSFLGMGTFGRVFKVSSRGQEGGRTNFMALKLVLPGDRGERTMELLLEKECLDAAARHLPHAVVHVREFHIFGDYGGALLLEHVGGKVPKQQWRQVFVTLGSLHEKNIVHGDSRMSNCIFVEGCVRWIDFRKSAVVATDPNLTWAKQRDMELLLRSCLHEEGRPESTFDQQWVDRYIGTSESAETTFNAFYAACLPRLT
jgi:hypothetical protein